MSNRNKKIRQNFKQKLRDHKKRFFFVISIALLALVILIGPLDCFTHGYYCDEIDMDGAAHDLGVPASLSESGVKVRFTPVKRHFAGFEIYMVGQAAYDTGVLHYSIEDLTGSVIADSSIPLSDIKNNLWYKVYEKSSCKLGREYFLYMRVEGSEESPALATIDSEYLGGEVLEGNVAISFAYREPTFSFSEKIIITLFLLVAWIFFAKKLTIEQRKEKDRARHVAVFLFMSTILAWNFMYNTFNDANESFSRFQKDSESLVIDSILADEDGLETGRFGGMRYGLSFYETSAGRNWEADTQYLSDSNWNEGYSKTAPDILLASCTYTRSVLSESSSVKFVSGDVFSIIKYEDDGTYMRVHLDARGALNPERYGKLDEMHFIGQDGEIMSDGRVTPYVSQFGLQGKIFLFASKLLGGRESIPFLWLIAAFATSAVLTILVMLFYKKCGIMFAFVSYAVFLLSPWVVNFARNLYWVEFTWFIPMIIGTYCSMQMQSRRRRIMCYTAACVSVTVKCLCGYEYISSIMLGLIAFPLVDYIMALTGRDKGTAKQLFQMNFALGISAVSGFFIAICLHATLRGDGDIASGIIKIIQEDVIRRTSGGNLNDFDAGYWITINASRWETLCKYFHFDTEIISGIAGSLFPLLCCIPLVIFFFDAKMGRLDKRLVIMYFVFFCIPISWFILAKAHSYNHTHMNYVLWYMGFVQICFYVIARWIYGNFGRSERP